MPLRAQDRQASAAPGKTTDAPTVTFRSGVSNVRIDAQVIHQGEILTGLTKDDFIVYDQDRPQEIVYFGRDSEPLSLLLLLDVSGSMKKYVEQMASVARQALRILRPGDRVGIMIFARESKVVLPLTTDFEEVARALRAAVNEESVGSSTLINDALLASAKYMDAEAGDKGRRAILVLTDNLGLNYKSPDRPVIDALWTADTVLNGLVVGKSERPDPKREGRYTNPDYTPPDVFLISEQTGGEAIKADRASTAFPKMVERIRTRYSLHYRTPPLARGFRRVKVELTPAVRMKYPGVEVQARKGYKAGG